ncbi:MAG TPA: hypothetical protein VFR81_21360 [Longimicrobium sp.]|nr:hypothetical protein [Longimicrobium sp.]
MKRVVERCPNCGVEHDDPRGGACEVCGTTLRYWCRVHSREIGWLEGPACPRCATEAAGRVPPRPTSRPPAAEPTVTARPHRSPPVVVEPAPPPRMAPPPEAYPPREAYPPAGAYPPPMRRDPREEMREHAEDLRPYAEAGARVAGRMFRAVFAIVRAVLFWGILGLIAGGAFAWYGTQDLDPIWAAMFGGFVGGGFGLFFGIISALRILFAGPPRDVR